MYLRQINLKNFRNISELVINPCDEFNIIWGDNAQGKTNFLESIYLLGNIRSFRTNKNEELIGINANNTSISGEVICQKVYHQLEINIFNNKKEIKVDGKNVNKVGQFLDYLRPVLFSPEEVFIVKGNPAGRRSLLDRAIFQVNPSYLELAQNYERCLLQRNRLLKEKNCKLEISSWTEQLIINGARIRFERILYLKQFVPQFKEIYSAITNGSENADLRYLTGIEDEEFLRSTLRQELARQEEREKLFGLTLSGPHRDDPLFFVNDRLLRTFGSQGQQRSFMLAFKTAQILHLEKQRGEPPVLLLDDMTGELDRHRQSFFFRFLLDRRGQVFITTTDIESFKKDGLKNARFFRASQGKIQ